MQITLPTLQSCKHVMTRLNDDDLGRLYSAANDPETANDPGPQMIPK